MDNEKKNDEIGGNLFESKTYKRTTCNRCI